jgi:predicted metal-dependent peptidase
MMELFSSNSYDLFSALSREAIVNGETLLLPILDSAIATDEIRTMGTTGTRVYINPSWARKIGVKKAFGVLIHELLHDIYQHHKVSWAQYVQDDLVSPTVWRELVNLAMDVIINDEVLEMGYQLPEEGAFRDKLGIPKEHTTSRQVFLGLLKKYKEDAAQRKLIDEALNQLMEKRRDEEHLIQISQKKPKANKPTQTPKQQPQPQQPKKPKGMTREQLILTILRDQMLFGGAGPDKKIYTRKELDAMTDEQLVEVYNSIDRSSLPQGDIIDQDLLRNRAIARTTLVITTQNNIYQTLATKSTTPQVEAEINSIQSKIETLLSDLNKDLDMLDELMKGNEDYSFIFSKLPNEQNIKSQLEDIERLQKEAQDKVRSMPDRTSATEDLDQNQVTAIVDKNNQLKEALSKRLVEEPTAAEIDQLTNQSPEDGDSDGEDSDGGNSSDGDLNDGSSDSADSDGGEKGGGDDGSNSSDGFGEGSDEKEREGGSIDKEEDDTDGHKDLSQEMRLVRQSLLSKTGDLEGKLTKLVAPGTALVAMDTTTDYIKEIFDYVGSHLANVGRSRTYHRPSRRYEELPDASGAIPILPGEMIMSERAKLTIYLDVSGSMDDWPYKILSRLAEYTNELENTRSLVVTFSTQLNEVLDLSLGIPSHLKSQGGTNIQKVLEAISEGREWAVEVKDEILGGTTTEIVDLKADVAVIITDLGAHIDLSVVPPTQRLVFVTNHRENAEAVRAQNHPGTEVIYTKEW